MTGIVASRRRNQRALLAFIGVLVAIVVVAVLAFLALQRQHLTGLARAQLKNEMILLGDLATDALLRSDYATVEGMVTRWVSQRTEITGITAVMPNGYVLADAHKPLLAAQPLNVIQDIVFNRRTLLTLQVTGDFSVVESGFATIVINVTAVALAAILLMSWLLWWTLKRTALGPLENEIRRREENERELLQRTAELNAANQELEAFSYSVSHDLRAPLRAIDGFAQALHEDYGDRLDATAHGYLKRVRAGTQRMGALIDDLLQLSRVGRSPLQPTTVDISALAGEITAELRAAAPLRSVTVEITPGMTVRGDARLLHAALTNLLANAWKYSGNTADARIQVGSMARDGETAYFVRDNGVGFDMQYSDKLFGAFQRLHGSEFPGSGVGLATVQRIIHRHGGRVWAEARLGEGATFWFTLSG